MPDPQDRPLSTPGRRPYGETAEERAIIAIVAARRAERWTWQRIADALNEAGRVQRNGRPWTASNVANVGRRAAAD